MISYMSKGFFSELWLGTILGGLNQMIYSFVGILCGLFSDISGIILFNGEVVEAFTKRIYVVLGIYMLFRLAISLLNSIVNPDNLLDKEKGLQKIIPRSVIALAMLVFVPSIFSLAFEYQNKIALAVPRIIIGKGSVENMEGQGEILAASALKAFFVPNKSECTDTADIDAAYNQLDTNDVDYMLSKLPTQACSSNSKVFLYQFNGVVSIVAGVFMVISLASYCVDIAIRSIKLGLLQILAPIPIISYIDPKSEKDGAFSHWTKECVSTYLELFIKLAILYFVIFILSSIATDGGKLLGSTNGANPSNPFILTFLIIGALFFMGKAAEFICNIIGVKPPKENGGFFKGLAGLAGMAAVTGGAISSGINRFKAGELLDKTKGNKTTFQADPKKYLFNKGKNIAKGVLGAVSGLAISGQAVASSKGMSKFSAANKKVMEANAKGLTRAAHGGSWLTDLKDDFGVYFGGSDSKVIAYQLNKEKALIDFINDKGSKKAKDTKLHFSSNSGDANYGRVKAGLLSGVQGSLTEGTLADFIMKKNAALNALQAGVGDGKFEWGGLTNIDVNDSNLDYFQSELTTLAGVEFLKDKMLSNDPKAKDDQLEIESALKAAGKKSMNDVVINDMKKSITEKENALRALDNK